MINYDRMIQLAETVFNSKADANQLDVDEDVISHLKSIHPATLSEYNDENGSAVWILMIPTTIDLMNRFLENDISEKELYELTPKNIQYESIYLCSALVLEEFRRKGIAKKLTLSAIESIKKDHPIKYLFIWPFSKEGLSLAEKVAGSTQIPLKIK